MRLLHAGVALAAGLAWGTPAPAAPPAGRVAVLEQVKLPHSYYWRELYVPQLTTGPSAAAFLPDGRGVIYSMEGSLWQQAIGTTEAREITHARGAYDFQPDVSPDGRRVVFARYDGRAIELWQLDLASGREQALTSGGDVNLEPRISPDGTRLAWVSTRGTGRFDLHVAQLGETLEGIRRLLPERRSSIDRYYYSAFDHSINPSWSPDGKTLYYVGNPEVSLGTGDLRAVDLEAPDRSRLVLSEETSWAARPEPAPSGPRLLYSSYRGRAWHQLWLTRKSGAPPLPLTFGEFDLRNARWSPDAQRIAAISNEEGNTTLVLIDAVGGGREVLRATTRRPLVPRSTLTLDIVDASGERVPARVEVLASDARAYAPRDAWMHADDAFDRSVQPIETHYFHCAPPCSMDVPLGRASVRIWRGLGTLPWSGTIEMVAGAPATLRAELKPNALPAAFGEPVSADLHVHMNYGGHYRSTASRLARVALAEDLDVVQNLIVNKEERIPDVQLFRPDADPASSDRTRILHAQEFHTSYWGHLGLLHLGEHLLLPDFAAYRDTAMASPWPHNGVIADLAHRQGALVGYVHPFDWSIVPEKEEALTHQLPADAYAGKVDYIEIVGFADHRSTAEVWYRLLNLGFRIPAGAGTDAMTNYASLRGPVGMNRVYLDTGGARDASSLRRALKAGRSVATNAPLLGLRLQEAGPGEVVARARGAGAAVPYRVSMRSTVPMQHVELVYNGKVIESFTPPGDRRSLDASGSLELPRGGWLLLRAWNDAPHPDVFDLYPYGTTSPVWLEGPEPAPPANADARYFVLWMQRVLSAAEARTDYNDEKERGMTIAYLRDALEGYQRLAVESRW